MPGVWNITNEIELQTRKLIIVIPFPSLKNSSSLLLRHCYVILSSKIKYRTVILHWTESDMWYFNPIGTTCNDNLFIALLYRSWKDVCCKHNRRQYTNETMPCCNGATTATRSTKSVLTMIVLYWKKLSEMMVSPWVSIANSSSFRYI